MPVRLARERVPGPGAAIRDENSANHEKRVEIAKQILGEAGLNPSVVRKALAYSGEQAQAAAVQIVRQRVDPARVKFAAAWYGLMSNSPAVTVFHPTRNGEDTLHVINSPHTSDHVAAYLRRAGIPKFTTEQHAGGTRAYVYDPGSTLQLDTFARGLDASHSQYSGVGYRLGAGQGADATAGGTAGGTAGSSGSRATYRDAIRDFESAASA